MLSIEARLRTLSHEFRDRNFTRAAICSIIWFISINAEEPFDISPGYPVQNIPKMSFSLESRKLHQTIGSSGNGSCIFAKINTIDANKIIHARLDDFLFADFELLF